MTVSSPGENATAAGGEIEFVTSADGTAIVSLSYVLENDECSYESESVSVTITGGGSTLTPGEPVRIANGKFVFDLLGIQATGQLNSPSEASGTITIKTQQSVDSPSFQQFTCDYGTWTWSANAQ
jgi:hypothetical protein